MKKEQFKLVVKETFDAVSDVYDINALRFFPESAKHFASLIRLRGDENVIDVATGTGHAALALAPCLPNGFVTGVDFSSGMLEQARRKAALMNIRNVEFLEMDMQSMTFSPDKFDAATCAFGIFFADDMETQLSCISSLVKPGGTVAICSFQEDYFQPLRGLMANRLADYGVKPVPQIWLKVATEAGCRELFEKVGIRDVQVEQKNVGFFLQNEKEWWDIIWNAGFRRMVAQLKPSDKEQFLEEHMKEVAALATKDGIWLDIGVLYTIGKRR